MAAERAAVSKWNKERKFYDPATFGPLYYATLWWRAENNEDGHYVYAIAT